MGQPQVQIPLPYGGEDLGPRPHVAVVFCDHIGDFVVATPLMRGLRERFPGLVLDYFGGEVTRELEDASPLVDARFSLFGTTDAIEDLPGFLAARHAAAGPYALAVNLEADPLAAHACGLIAPRYVVGACVDPGTGQPLPKQEQGIDALWRDTWNRSDLLVDYPELSSPYIAEIFCHLARVPTDYARTEVPSAPPPFPTPPILLSTGGNRSAKLWPAAHWLTLARWLRGHGLEAGLLGAPPARRAAYHAEAVDDALVAVGVRDLRGTLSLPEVAGALRQAQAFVTIDSGLFHLAAAAGAPTIGLFGASPRRIWVPPLANVHVLEPSAPCTRCEENRFRNADCLLPVHQCMLTIEPDRVTARLAELLGPGGYSPAAGTGLAQ
jgi:ADP-heptose:LPS heptosyltransferase